MKPNRDATELAARLGSAMAKPPPLPSSDTERIKAAPQQPSTPVVRTTVKPELETTSRRGRPPIDTKGITLRPTKALLKRYTLAAAERTRTEGRVISAQEIMLEQLERGP